MNIFMTNNVFPIGRHIAYGGERIVFYLIEELVKLGHDVHVFAREGSDFNGIKIASYTPVGPLDSRPDVHYEAALTLSKKTGIEPDVYQCNYFGNNWKPECRDFAPVYTELTWCKWCHGVPYQREGGHPHNVISYSRVLQSDFIQDRVLTTMIHYGIPKDLYTFQPEHDGYAVWIGKIEGGKRPDLAIELALAAGLKIVIMGPPYNTGTFWQQVAPYLDKFPDKVFWVRGVDDAQKYKIMSRARCFISSNDNTWKEHFGIVNIEALAMGVPIIGFNRIGQDCAIKTDTIIEDGIHGFLLNYYNSNDTAEILEKGLPLLQKIDTIDRAACRQQFEARFTSELMARRYEWFYKHVMENGPVLLTEVPF